MFSRNKNVTMEEHTQNGERLFKAMYRETGDGVQALLDEIYPDMGMHTLVS